MADHSALRYRLMVSTHEAAHAVVASALRCRVLSVSLEPPEVEVMMIAVPLRDQLAVLLAGNVAIARAGLVDRSAPDETDAEQLLRQRDADRLELVFARSCAEALVTEHWSAISRVAMRLMDAGSLTGEDVRRQMRAPDEGQGFLVTLALGS